MNAILYSKSLLLLCGVVGSVDTYAQSDTTRTLNEVVVQGFAPEKFMSGLKLQRADTTLQQLYKFQTLADFLATQVPVHFKSYGSGQLSTVSFRGLSASHTAVLWNGININNPFSSLTDFSTIPMGAFNKLSIQYGVAASTVGTDAIAGSILLESISPIVLNDGSNSILKLDIGQRVASFNNLQSQVTTSYQMPLRHKGLLISKSAWLYTHNPNLYPYSSRRGFLVEPSTHHQQSFIQDLVWQKPNNQNISMNIWLADNQAVLSPAIPTARELTRTQAYRFLTNYQFKNTLIRAGLIRDIIDYGKGVDTPLSHSANDRFLLRIEQDIDTWTLFRKPLTIKLGTEVAHYRTQVDEYNTSAISENRADLYALVRYQPSTRLTSTLNLRQAFVTHYDPPFTPSLGIDFIGIKSDNQQLVFKMSVARSYRVPTLNERYWRILGNPTLKPEQGFGQEVGANYQRQFKNQCVLKTTLSLFNNQIDDWTYWNPAKGYRVENLQLVRSRGIEVQAGINKKIHKWNSGVFAQYALTHSTQLRVYDATAIELVGKQLVFVPLHAASVNGFIQYQKFRFSTNWQVSSKRYTTFDNSKYLKGYQLVHVIVEAMPTWRNIPFRITAQIDNVFDALYLNVKGNAMAGRSFAVSLSATPTIFFKQN